MCEVGKFFFIMGFVGISEGVIFFVVEFLFKVILVMVFGFVVGGVLVVGFGVIN